MDRKKLRQVLAQEDAVLFLGAGISIWSGLPSWWKLIDELAQFLEAEGLSADAVRAEQKHGDLLQAASFGFDLLTKPQIGQFIRNVCRHGVARPHEIHRRIVSLGPRCFITTNYDTLVEDSLRLWRPERALRGPITNRQLTEIADIIHARSADFVFKPHGDVGDIESIILTREQYRALLPGGERHAALEALKMLMATRPFVYLGFGLRDPNFFFLQDLLANTFKGSARDHYAIMADTTDAEERFWRKNYGIHLVSYPTEGGKHTPLLALLDELAPAPAPAPRAEPEPALAPEELLRLARYAAGLTRAPRVERESPLQVSSHRALSSAPELARSYQHEGMPIEAFLAQGPTRAALIGPPGAGKTYALRRAVASLAEALHGACLAEPVHSEDMVVPIYVDLKLYRGDLYRQMESELPPKLPLSTLARSCKLKLFVDSFNELPREHWESGAYEADFVDAIAKLRPASAVIASRSADGLAKLSLPAYSLDQIDEEFVAEELGRLGIALEGRFRGAALALLQKPFYFSLVVGRRIALPKEPRPRDLFQAVFDDLSARFQARFGAAFDLVSALSLAAYDAIDRGEEARALADILDLLDAALRRAGVPQVNASEVANWLVASDILVASRNSRVSFFHQSATEYLAASELARRFQLDRSVVGRNLRLTRWDQAIFLALSLLPEDEAGLFIDAVIEADLVLALNASKYMEHGREEVVARLLVEVVARAPRIHPLEFGLWSALKRVEVSQVHGPHLRALMKLGDVYAAAAVEQLVKLEGSAVKQELLDELYARRDDYNYCCNGIAMALEPHLESADLPRLFELTERLGVEMTPDANEDDARGFVSGCAALLARLELEAVRAVFLPGGGAAPPPEARGRVLCALLDKHHTTAALDMAGELLLAGVTRAATSIYFISRFRKPAEGLSWASFHHGHVDRLLEMIRDPEEQSWGVRALRQLCQARADLADHVTAETRSARGIYQAAARYCASRDDLTSAFESLTELARMSPEQRRAEPLHLLQQLELDWSGHEGLLVELLKLRDIRIALPLLERLYAAKGMAELELELGPIDWWIEWLAEVDPLDDKNFFFLDRVSDFLVRHLSADAKQVLVTKLGDAEPRVKWVLARSVLPKMADLTSDGLGEAALAFLIADLRAAGGRRWQRRLLGHIATERFVVERLLPLISSEPGRFQENLRAVIRQAGRRHGRRYLPG